MAKTFTEYSISSVDAGKLVAGTRGTWSFTFTYQDLMKVTASSYDHLCKMRERKRFHPENAESIFLFVCRYGKQKLKIALLEQILKADTARLDHPHSLESFSLWMARHSSDSLKARALKMMLQHELEELPGKSARPGKHRLNGSE
jgi:hypothetical protein